jgi:hypothetical protein
MPGLCGQTFCHAEHRGLTGDCTVAIIVEKEK